MLWFREGSWVLSYAPHSAIPEQLGPQLSSHAVLPVLSTQLSHSSWALGFLEGHGWGLVLLCVPDSPPGKERGDSLLVVSPGVLIPGSVQPGPPCSGDSAASPQCTTEKVHL